jgi:hypothetical protein
MPSVDGWISAFYAVDKEGAPRQYLSKLDFGTVPPDRGTFDFKIRPEFGGERNFSLMSGFSGVGQSPDGALFPELGWSAWEKSGSTFK